VLVTYEMSSAHRAATATIFMHEGLIHEAGSPAEMFAEPRTPEFRRFIPQSLK
jgi:polar amino acid transport system ATP-binding protein